MEAISIKPDFLLSYPHISSTYYENPNWTTLQDIQQITLTDPLLNVQRRTCMSDCMGEAIKFMP